MTRAEKTAYNKEVRRIAKKLGISLRGNIEAALIKYCKNEVDKLIASCVKPRNLIELLNHVATSLGVVFKEIYEDSDLTQLEQEIPPEHEPIIARLRSELDDKTDALILERQNRLPWEQPYLAVINCRGVHLYKKYFSKWHEIVHLLLDGKQLRLAFRRTPSKKYEAEEVIVDRVAAVLAYHPSFLEPAFNEEVYSGNRITFSMVDRIREKIAPEGSRQSALIACIKESPELVCFMRAGYGYKKDEERLLKMADQLQLEQQSAPVMKLRVRQATISQKMNELGIHFFKNMEIPEESIISKVFEGYDVESYSGTELLQSWTTSRSGPIGYGEIEVEARRVPSLGEVWAIIHLVKTKNII